MQSRRSYIVLALERQIQPFLKIILNISAHTLHLLLNLQKENRGGLKNFQHRRAEMTGKAQQSFRIIISKAGQVCLDIITT